MWTETKRLADEFAHKIGVRDPFIDLYIQQNMDWEKENAQSSYMPTGEPTWSWMVGDTEATTYAAPTEQEPVTLETLVDAVEPIYEQNRDLANMLTDAIHAAVAQELRKMITWVPRGAVRVPPWEEDENGE